MTDKLIEQIKADREAGTPGPWLKETHHKQGYDRLVPVWYVATKNGAGVAVQPSYSDPLHEEANARRIASVPDMEARILADEQALKEANEVIKAADRHLVKRLKALQVYFDLSEEELESMGRDARADTIRQHRLITEALDAFHRAMQGRKECSHVNQEVVGPDDPELLEILHGQT